MIHVYKIPQKRSNGYCFNGPVPIEFGNVDWMDDPEPKIPREEIERWLQQKMYFTAAKSGDRFLVLCDARPELTFQMVKP